VLIVIVSVTGASITDKSMGIITSLLLGLSDPFLPTARTTKYQFLIVPAVWVNVPVVL
jgi:hypothetical protein